MSMRYLGESFDVHTGGIDLIFPHHEDEIAQSEAATGEPFVHTWMHCAHLHMQGEKMAKRTGNFARPADVYAAGISPRVLRYALLATHYRSPLEFSDESLAHAGAAVERYSTAVTALDAYAEERADDASLPGLLADARAAFAAGLEDDLNVSAALAALFDLIRELNSRMAQRTISTADARRGAALLRELDGVLGVLEDAAHELSRGPGCPARRAPCCPGCAGLGAQRRAPRGAGCRRHRRRGHARRAALAPDRRRMKRDRPDERDGSGSGKPRGRSGGGGASYRGRTPGALAAAHRTTGARGPLGARRPGTDGGRSGAGHGGPSGASGASSSGRDTSERGSSSERRETGRPSTARQRPDGPPGGRRSTGREPGPDRSTSWRRAGEGNPRHGPGDADRPDRPPFDRREPGDGPPWRRAARFARDPSDRARRPDRDQGGAPKHPGPRPDRPFGRPRPPDGSSDAPARRGPRPAGGPWDRPRPGRPRPAHGAYPVVHREPDVAAHPWSGLVPEDVLRPDEEVVAGRRPVEEAFAARRPALRLLVVPGRRAALDQLVLHATTLRIPVVEVEGGTITAISGFDGHQGVALVVEPRRWATLDEVLALARTRSEPPFVLVLDHLEDPQNVGTLLRSAEAAGVHGVVFPRRGSAPLSPAAVKTSAGATEHLLLVPLDDLPAGLVDLHTRGVRIVGADGDASLTVRELDLRGPLAVVIGSEGRGLDVARAAARRCHGAHPHAGSHRLAQCLRGRVDLPLRGGHAARPARGRAGGRDAARSEPTLTAAASTDADPTDPGPDDRLADASATGEAAAEGAGSHALPEASASGTDDERCAAARGADARRCSGPWLGGDACEACRSCATITVSPPT